MPKKYPYCHRYPTPSGVPRWYVRRRVNGVLGPKIRVHGEFGSAAFEQNYHAILAGNTPGVKQKKIASRGTLRWLVEMWKQSSDWQSQATATRKQRENILVKVLEDAGDWDFEDIQSSDLKASMERRKNTPAAANNFLKTMRALFRWAKYSDLIQVDPTEGVRRMKSKTEGFKPWTIEEVFAFRERWPLGTRERVALELLLNTGLRRGDAVRLGRPHVKNGVATIHAEKTKVVLYIPINETLEAALAAGPTGDLTFIASANGKPMGKEYFGNWFRDVCNETGIEKSAHGLRKLAATILANTSGSEHELQALFGWRSNKQSMIYTREADKLQLALRAAKKLKTGLEQK